MEVQELVNFTGLDSKGVNADGKALRPGFHTTTFLYSTTSPF